MHRGSEQTRDDGDDDGAVKAVFRGQTGNQGVGHTLGQNNHRPGQPRDEIGTQAAAAHPGHPLQEGEEPFSPHESSSPHLLRELSHRLSTAAARNTG